MAGWCAAPRVEGGSDTLKTLWGPQVSAAQHPETWVTCGALALLGCALGLSSILLSVGRQCWEPGAASGRDVNLPLHSGLPAGEGFCQWKVNGHRVVFCWGGAVPPVGVCMEPLTTCPNERLL